MTAAAADGGDHRLHVRQSFEGGELRLHPAYQPVGLFDPGPEGCLDVDLHPARRDVPGKELGAGIGRGEQRHRTDQREQRQPHHQRAPPQRPAQHCLIAAYDPEQAVVHQPAAAGLAHQLIERDHQHPRGRQQRRRAPAHQVCGGEGAGRRQQEQDAHRGRQPAAGCAFGLQQPRRQRRQDHQRHEQRRTQRDDQGQRQVFHELADQSRPERQRHERRESGGGGGNDRRRHFTGGEAGRAHAVVAALAVAVDVLHHHDGVVHQHAQGQDQAEQHHHVQGESHQLHDHERDQHGQRDRQPHERRGAQAEEEQQDGHHQQQARNDVVLQAAHHAADFLRLVGGQLDHGSRGKRRPGRGDHLSYGFGGFDDVLATALYHGQRDDRNAVQPREAVALLEAEVHLRHIAHVDGAAVAGLDDDVGDVGGRLELARHPHQVLEVPYVDGASRYRDVLEPDRVADVLEGEAVEFQLGEVDVHEHFALESARQPYLQHARNLLDTLLQLLGHLPQPHRVVGPGDVDLHDGKLRGVDLEDLRIVGG